MRMTDMTTLLKRLRSGDEQALRSLFTEMYPTLCTFADRYLHNPDEAADIAQEAFLKYWVRREHFDTMNRIRAFLYITVRRACLNHIRNRAGRNESLDETLGEVDVDFYQQIMEEEAHRILNQAIDRLPEQLRKVMGFALLGFRNAEIALRMHITEGTVHAYKKEAYKRLRADLHQHYYLLAILVYLLE